MCAKETVWNLELHTLKRILIVYAIYLRRYRLYTGRFSSTNKQFITVKAAPVGLLEGSFGIPGTHSVVCAI